MSGRCAAAAAQATEDFAVHLFEDCNLCAIHAKRVTISECGAACAYADAAYAAVARFVRKACVPCGPPLRLWLLASPTISACWHVFGAAAGARRLNTWTAARCARHWQQQHAPPAHNICTTSTSHQHVG